MLVAAGRGERLGSDGPKALVALRGRPMWEWSLDVLRATCAQVVVALPPGVQAPAGCTGVPGGVERSHSVRNALAASSGDPVLVHDAARPMLTEQVVRDVLAALADGADAAFAAARVVDTVREAPELRTLDRERLWAVQTPQGFRREVLERALAQDDAVLARATDDVALVQALGPHDVRPVQAPRTNFKVTTPEDLRLAELVLDADGPPRPPQA